MGLKTRLRSWLMDDLPVLEGTPSELPTGNVKRVGYEYGAAMYPQTPGMAVAAETERLQLMGQLYQTYLTCPWVSAPIDLIARTVTAGGLKVVYDNAADTSTSDVPAQPAEVDRLKRLLRFCNPREDMVQLLRAAVIDLLLFGDAFIEVVEIAGEPVALYTLDATTMTVLTDPHGEVSGYVQDMDGLRKAEFEPDQVIHISLDAPRGGVYGVGPAQKSLLPVTAWLFTEATIKECFRRGDPPRLHIDLRAAGNSPEVQKFREQYMVYNLGPKAIGTPIITTNGGNVQVLDPRKVPDYLSASRQLRDEIITSFGVPPAKLGIIESGNIGGGTAEGQDLTFRVNTIIPVQALVLEKINYHLMMRGFGLTDWRLDFGQIDYRDSKVIEEIRGMRVKVGAYTINRYRDEIGEPPVEGGDEPLVATRSGFVLVRDLEAASSAEIAADLRGTALEPGNPEAGKALTLTKPEPAPVPDQLKPFAGVDNQPGEPADALPPASGKEPGPPQESAPLLASYRARLREAMRDLPAVEEAA